MICTRHTEQKNNDYTSRNFLNAAIIKQYIIYAIILSYVKLASTNFDKPILFLSMLSQISFHQPLNECRMVLMSMVISHLIACFTRKQYLG